MDEHSGNQKINVEKAFHLTVLSPGCVFSLMTPLLQSLGLRSILLIVYSPHSICFCDNLETIKFHHLNDLNQTLLSFARKGKEAKYN